MKPDISKNNAQPPKKYIVVSGKPWHDGLFENLSATVAGEWKRMRAKQEFTETVLALFDPDLVFIPHWSYLIPAGVYEQYACIVFHMTDLPYGRGGSPLQNLIARGIQQTMISAIRVTKGLDTGDVYLKRPLSLHGTAEEIFIRSAAVVETMIRDIILQNPQPVPQQGEPVLFVRRKPEDGNIAQLQALEQVYDYIRMLDAEGYPKAFVEVGNLRLEFSRATLKTDQSLLADVRITQK